MERLTTYRSTAAIVVASLLFAGGVFVRFRVSAEAFQYVILVALLAFISAEDLKTRTIPDRYILSAVGLRMLYALALVAEGALDLQRCVYFVISGAGMWLALALFSMLFEQVTGHESMGGGDVKLYAVSGLYLGFSGAIYVVALSCAIALGMSVFMRPDPRDGDGLARTFPFGPAIALSFGAIALVHI